MRPPLQPLLQRWNNWRAASPGIAYSSLLHILLLVVMVSPLDWLEPERPEVFVKPINVDIVNVSDITNAPPKEGRPQPTVDQEEPKPLPATEKPEQKKPEKKAEIKEKPKKPEKPKEKAKPKPAPVKKDEKPKPKKAKEKEKPKPKEKAKEAKAPEKKPVKKPEKTAEEKKIQPKSLDKKEQTLTSLLKSVETEEASGQQSQQGPYDATKPLSISEIEAVIRQISECWIVPAGARDAQNIAVLIDISLQKDGAVQKVDIVDQARYNGSKDPFFRAAADSAVRAVQQCSPLKGLPAQKYDQWKKIRLNFDPKELIY